MDGWKKAGIAVLGAYLFARGCWEAEYRTAMHIAAQSPPITSALRISEIIEEESRKLKVEGEFLIHLNEQEEHFPVGSARLEQDSYAIIVPATLHGVRESMIRHEMFHIAERHHRITPLPWLAEKIAYYWWCEPRALYYEATGKRP